MRISFDLESPDLAFLLDFLEVEGDEISMTAFSAPVGDSVSMEEEFAVRVFLEEEDEEVASLDSAPGIVLVLFLLLGSENGSG